MIGKLLKEPPSAWVGGWESGRIRALHGASGIKWIAWSPRAIFIGLTGWAW